MSLFRWTVAPALVLALMAATCRVQAAEDRVAQFEFGPPGSDRHAELSFWVHADGTNEISYSQGKDSNKITLVPLKVNGSDEHVPLRTGLPGGGTLSVSI